MSIFVPKGKFRRRLTRSLPVAGIDETRAQSILVSLREENTVKRHSMNVRLIFVKVEEVMEAWLSALQLSQIVTDR